MKAHKKPSIDLSTISGRVIWLLQKVWLGSQTKMAKDLGIAQGSLSNVMTGKRTPGRQVLAAISAHPLVNPTWLLTGDGRPFDEGASAHTLPVAGYLLTSAPEANWEAIVGIHPVAALAYRAGRYYHQVSHETPGFDQLADHLRLDDLLLVETDFTEDDLNAFEVGVVLEANTSTPTLAVLREKAPEAEKESHGGGAVNRAFRGIYIRKSKDIFSEEETERRSERNKKRSQRKSSTKRKQTKHVERKVVGVVLAVLRSGERILG